MRFVSLGRVCCPEPANSVVAIDRRRPTCKNCESRNQVCRGYRRNEFTFMNEGWKPHGATPRANRSKLPTPQASLSPRGRETRSPLARPLSSRSLVVYGAFFLSEFKKPFGPGEIFLQARLLRAFQLLWSGKKDTDMPITCAIEALAAGYFARIHNDRVSRDQSMLAYGRALKCLTSTLTEMQCVGLDVMSDSDWDDFHFSCLLLTLWELDQHPGTSNWKVHIRALGLAMEKRGASTLRCPELTSSTRFFVLLEKLSGTEARSTGKLPQKSEDTRSHWCLWPSTQLPIHTGFAPRTVHDAVLDDLAEAVNIRTQYSQLVWESGNPRLKSQSQLALDALAKIYERADAIVHRRELALYFCRSTMRDVPVAEVPVETNMAEMSDYVSKACALGAPRGGFDASVPATALIFSSVNEIHTMQFGWITLMATRLIQCDIINSIQRAGNGARGHHAVFDAEEAKSRLQQHRSALVECVRTVLRSIPYQSIPDSLDLTPFFVGSVFFLAHTVLGKECEWLTAEPDRDSELQSCVAAQAVLERYLGWVAERKITIRLDWSG
ncbi:hypothetical protein GQ53DRAFT_846287 [Thozetella sp. PMI_491]|nr:hypothetical protein GQ53DRAFT_846287 [Thozetella sp. PMI_491]